MPLAFALLGLLLLSGCSSWNFPTLPTSSWQLPSMTSLPYLSKWKAIEPYTLDIQQGIILEADMIARLKPGQSRKQVGFILGTPLLTDPFHANRWDYVYYTRTHNVLSHPKILTIYFTEGKLDHFTRNFDDSEKTASAQETPPGQPTQTSPKSP